MSAAADPNGQRGLDLSIALTSLLIGFISVLLPESNKLLCVVFALCTPIVFLPIGSKADTSTSQRNWSQFWSFFEIIRYLCVAWAALLIAQQIVKSEVSKAGSEAFAESTVAVSKSIQDGRRNDVRVAILNRVPYFTSATTFVVQAQSPTKAIAIDARPVLVNLATEQSKTVEGLFIWMGVVIASFTILLRLAHGLAYILLRPTPSPEN